MSSSTTLKSLLPISDSMVSMESRMETPARRKALSWREKCISSLRGTFLRVISNWKSDFFSVIVRNDRPRSSRAVPTPARSSASNTPADSVPSPATATYLNFGIVCRPSAGVDDADDFGDGGDVGGDEGQALVEEGAHPLGDGHAPDLLLGGPPDDEALDLGGDAEQLVDAD